MLWCANTNGAPGRPVVAVGILLRDDQEIIAAGMRLDERNQSSSKSRKVYKCSMPAPEFNEL